MKVCDIQKCGAPATSTLLLGEEAHDLCEAHRIGLNSLLRRFTQGDYAHAPPPVPAATPAPAFALTGDVEAIAKECWSAACNFGAREGSANAIAAVLRRHVAPLVSPQWLAQAVNAADDGAVLDPGSRAEPGSLAWCEQYIAAHPACPPAQDASASEWPAVTEDWPPRDWEGPVRLLLRDGKTERIAWGRRVGGLHWVAIRRNSYWEESAYVTHAYALPPAPSEGSAAK